MENMMNLFKEPVEVKDLPNAPPLVMTKSSIEFKNVCFAYDPRKQILKDVSFKVPEGTF
jgi:ABC-type transport system involved in Fe-S cluster assembly fused permease/ATPase subunit